MKISYKLDRSFGPNLAFSGWVLFVTGIIFISSVTGIILFLAGFMLATFTDGTQIDTDKRRVRRYSTPFAIPVAGKWENIEDHAGLTVIPVKRHFAVYSRSNRSNISDELDYRVFLTGNDRKTRFALLKKASQDAAVAEMDKLSGILHIPVMTIDTLR